MIIKPGEFYIPNGRKNKQMKHIIYMAILAVFVGCQSPSQQNNNSSQPKEDKEYIEPEVITFNDDDGEADISRNFYFIFDVSGSMNESCAGERKIDGAKMAIFEFLKKVPEDVNIGLMLLGVKNEYGIEEVVPLGKNNLDQFKAQIESAEPTGSTPLSNAIIVSSNKLVEQYKKQLGYGEYRLIVITDGIASNPDLFLKNLKMLQRYPFIALYGIGLCIDTDHALKNYSIKYTDAYNYEEFGKALQETLSELEAFDPSDINDEDFSQLGTN